MQISAATDGTELLKALVTEGDGSTADGITVDGQHDFYLATDDGTNGYLYYCSEAANTELVASEIALVGTFSAALLGTIASTETVMI